MSTTRLLVVLFGLLGAVPASSYPLRFPTLPDGARKSIEGRFRARNPDLPISRVSVDVFGFIDLLVVERIPVEGEPRNLGDAETQFWIDWLRTNAAFFGLAGADALHPIPAPMQRNFNQMLGGHLLATILISKPVPGGLPTWEVRGHFWPGASAATPRIDGKTLQQKLGGARLRYVEGGRMYPCDSADPKHPGCPPGPPAHTVESTVDAKDIRLELRTILLRPWKKSAELRTVWHAWVNLTGHAQVQILRGKPKLVLDAVTGEDLTVRAAGAI